MRVAMPYYGKLIDPRRGFSRLFFIADVDPASGKITALKLETMLRSSAANFAGWLKNLLVSGVLSTDRPDYHLAKLRESGLWHSEVSGLEPDEQVCEWLHNQQQPHAAAPAQATDATPPAGPKQRRLS